METEENHFQLPETLHSLEHTYQNPPAKYLGEKWVVRAHILRWPSITELSHSLGAHGVGGAVQGKTKQKTKKNKKPTKQKPAQLPVRSKEKSHGFPHGFIPIDPRPPSKLHLFQFSLPSSGPPPGTKPGHMGEGHSRCN